MEHKHPVFDTDTHFTIDPITRQIKNASHKKTTLMQFDHNSERFTFECPRYIEAHDMAECNRVEVHYMTIDGNRQNSGVYTVDDLQIMDGDETQVTCSWVISANATQLAGALSFLLRFLCVEGDIITYSWNTDMFQGQKISKGIDASGAFETEYVDIIEQWKASVMGYFSSSIAAWKDETSAAIREETFEHMTALAAYVTPQLYGAVGDGVHDDTEAFQQTLSAHRNVYVPEGVYMIRTSTDDTAEYGDGEGIGVEIPSNTRLVMHNNAVLKGIPNKSSRYRVLWAKDSENIVINGGRIECDKESASGSHGFGLLFRHTKNVTVEDMVICNALADCVTVGCYADQSNTGSECENVTIRNCELYGSRRQGITLSGVDGCLIDGCYIHDVSGLNPQSGIDIEVNNANEQKNTNIKIVGCRFEDNTNYDVIVSNGLSTDTVEISGCTSYGVITNMNNLFAFGSHFAQIRASGGSTRIIGCNITNASSTTEDAYFTDCIIQETHVGEDGRMTVEHCTFISEGQNRVCYCHSGVMTLNNCTFKVKNCAYALQGDRFVANSCVFDVVTDDTFSRLAYVDDGVFNGCTVSIDNTSKEAFSVRSADGILKVIGCKFLTGFNVNVASSMTNKRYVGNIFCVAPTGNLNNATYVHGNIDAY